MNNGYLIIYNAANQFYILDDFMIISPDFYKFFQISFIRLFSNDNEC